MKTVSVREARQHIGSLLDAVKTGESIIITRRGQPAAKLTVVEAEDTKISFPDRTEFRKQIPASKKPSATLLREMRDERKG